jgi:hypothetical protein
MGPSNSMDAMIVTGVITSLVSIIVSIVATSVIIGIKWGGIQSDVRYIKDALGGFVTKDDLIVVKEKLARIDGMFEMKLKE